MNMNMNDKIWKCHYKIAKESSGSNTRNDKYFTMFGILLFEEFQTLMEAEIKVLAGNGYHLQLSQNNLQMYRFKACNNFNTITFSSSDYYNICSAYIDIVMTTIYGVPL